MDARWNNDVLNPAFAALTADDFEVIQYGWGQGTPPAAPAHPHYPVRQEAHLAPVSPVHWSQRSAPITLVVPLPGTTPRRVR